MTQKLHIKTWGCQMNEYDSSKMADLLLNTHGLELTDIPEEADDLRAGRYFIILSGKYRRGRICEGLRENSRCGCPL